MNAKNLRDRTDITRDTLRHYIDIKLLEPEKNIFNGYYEYTEADIEKVEFILRAKDLGFSLDEIRQLDKNISNSECPHQSSLPHIRKNLESVKQKITDLKKIEKHLKSLTKDFEKRDCTKHPTSFKI